MEHFLHLGEVLDKAIMSVLRTFSAFRVHPTPSVNLSREFQLVLSEINQDGEIQKRFVTRKPSLAEESFKMSFMSFFHLCQTRVY